ncbi:MULTISPECIES: 5-oxoprolinase subunit C family protein [unclassified Cytobacillus]|uniref:5-oxoprolinase subunit C family protein n=1 Tax=unclassified Cytobacillus TaxID=2675268 RepID=UPI001357B802|nr:biotin-dependent carboxyltransferase family protein [Cytobacillus sp. AMY 15.2]KAF0815555.1 Allophanate hydrolase 2 subunit 2 [Bacillus sp. ZZV12-4809]
MIKVLKPGLLSSIQDLGRTGYQKFGIIASGAMDPFSHRMANLLAGNEENEPTMEITMMGPVLAFEEDTLISICGGDLSPSINGQPIRTWRSVFVKKGSELKFGGCKKGCRAYLAAAGGFAVPEIMNSKSTYLRAGLGGFKGRALKSGDVLETGKPSLLSLKMTGYLSKQLLDKNFVENDWGISSKLIPEYVGNPEIRITRGRQFELFSHESRIQLFNDVFEVTAQSDRMGYRLKGLSLALSEHAEQISEAVNFGSIQVPPDGNPIVLLADRQTTGGYPKIGQVAAVDLPLLAQAKPGDALQFTEITSEQAQQLLIKREIELKELKQGILLKIRGGN